MSVKRRTRKPPLSLSKAEIAEIDGLIDGYWQNKQNEQEHDLHRDQESLDKLVHASPTTPWPTHVGRRPVSGRDGFLHVREADGPLESASVVEIARHNGMIRYALAPGSAPYDAHDPGWRFILARARGTGTDNFDRVFDEAVNDLLDTNVTLSPDIRQIIKGDRQTARDPKRRERNKDDALAFAVENHVRFVAGLLRNAGYKDAQTRAAEHAAAHWHKIIKQDGGRARFNSGRALSLWLRRHRGGTKNTPKM